MKFIPFVIICLIIAQTSAMAQGENGVVGKYYTFIQPERLNKCNLIGDVIAGNDIIDAGVQFVIKKKLATYYVIQILINTTDNAFNTKFVGVPDKQQLLAGPVIYFNLPYSTFVSSCEERLQKTSFTLGAVIIPIKMRFGSSAIVNGQHLRNFDFQGNVNLGLLVGFKLQPTHRYSFSFLTGISLTSVPVDSATTQGFITQSTNNAALTWNILGIVYQIDNFQIGVITGIDYLSGEIAHHWVYRNRPWLGIGLGFSIFSPKKTSDTQ